MVSHYPVGNEELSHQKQSWRSRREEGQHPLPTPTPRVGSLLVLKATYWSKDCSDFDFNNKKKDLEEVGAEQGAIKTRRGGGGMSQGDVCFMFASTPGHT